MSNLAVLLVIVAAQAREPAPADGIPPEPTTEAGSEPAPAPVAPTPTPDPSPTAGTFRERLEGAKKLYFQGHREDALDLLAALEVAYLVDADVAPWDIMGEALVYLGEVYYYDEQADKAFATWRLVLERDPDYPRLSPFAHPPDVAGEFERLRGTIKEEIAARPQPEPEPVPWWTAAPLGLPQMIDGRPVRGVAYGALQIGFGAGSIASYAAIARRNVATENHPLGWTQEEQRRILNTERWALQVPLFAATYGVWLGSFLDARSHWKRTHAVDAVGIVPAAGGGATIAVGGRF